MCCMPIAKQNIWLPLWVLTLLWSLSTTNVLAQNPGQPFPPASEMSDQKTGSVLFYNLFNSSGNAAGVNTEIGLTNTHATNPVAVRMFVVDGVSGATGRLLLQVAPKQTVSFLVSGFFFNVRGYLMAVAVDATTGCPVNFNYLTGIAYLKLATGHAGLLNAVAFAALTATPAACGGPTTMLNFDGVSYNRAPRVLALNNITARGDSNDTLLIVNRVGGDLSFGGNAATLGTLFGILYDDAEVGYSYSFNATGPQRFSILQNGFPNLTPPFETVIPAGRTGWMRFYNLNNDFAYLGAALNTNPGISSNANAYAACDNLSYRTLAASASYTLPVGFPDIAVNLTNSGNFVLGGTGSYTITVSNVGAQPLGGLGHLARFGDLLPNGLTLASFSGTGWSCQGTGTRNVFCSNSANIAAGAGLPPLVLNVNIGVGTPTSITNSVRVDVLEDANPANNTASNTVTVVCPTIIVNPPNVTLANGFVGTAYAQTLTATGGTAPHTFAVTPGSLPNGLTLASGGTLTGTPTAAGTFSFTVTATDNNGCTGTRAYTVIVSGAGLQFFALPAPVRLLDTRTGASPNACSQPNAPIAGGTARLQAARNFCGIPANAQALTGNITTVQSGGGYLTLYPSGATQPTVASTNYGANEIVNNVFTVGLGAGDGAFNIFAQMTSEVVVDVTGYYAPPAANGLYFHALPAPVRLLETRAGEPVGCVKPGVPLMGGTDSLQTATTPCTGIPAAARSVVGNATTVSPAGIGYLTLYPADVATAPLVASSNYTANQIVNGPFTVGLSPSRQFKIFTTQTTHLVVDVIGYYSTEAVDANGAGLLFTPLAHPVRLLETRNNAAFPGCFKPNAPLNGGQVYTQAARGLCEGLTIPATALGVVGNATVVFPAGGGFLTLWPSSAAQPTVATANYDAGAVVNRHFIVGLGQADGAFKQSSNVTTDLVIDLSGYFAP